MSTNYFLSELLFLCFRHHGSLHVAAHGRTTFIFCLLLADADLSLLLSQHTHSPAHKPSCLVLR